jgi:predicted kinase
MKITFVIGPAGAGKSTYIKKKFPNRTIIDLYDYQQKYQYLNSQTVLQSYEDCKEGLKEALRRNEDVVLEHTLLRAIRRNMYIDAVREITNDPIDIVVIKPSLEVLRERCIEREIYIGDANLEQALDMLDIPKKEDGFNNITIIED